MTGGVVAELPTVLTTAELCERWRCTPRTLERMARDGRIRRVKLRGGVRYPTDEVLRIERGEDRVLAGAPDAAPAAVAVPPSMLPTLAAVATPIRMMVTEQAPPSDRCAARLSLDSQAPAERDYRSAERHRSGPAPRGRGPVVGRRCAPTSLPAAVERGSKRPTGSPLHRNGEGPLSLPPVVERSWYAACIAHRKGGVAKSTTTWYLARELARAGKRVLLRDLDPQQGLRDILRDHGCEDGRYSRSIALVTDGEPLPFTPDVELIDTPPALDDSLPGVARADVVIVPAMPEHQAVRALERMLVVLKQTRHEHPFTRVLGILPVRVKPRWTEHAAFLRQIEILGERFAHPVLPSIPESRAVLTYSLRGRLWRPLGEAVLADMDRHPAGRSAPATTLGGA